MQLNSCHIALLTRIGLLSLVYPDVFLQLTRISETLVTYLTNIWLLLTMYPHLYLQVIRFSETVATLLTHIRLSSVDPHVHHLPFNEHLCNSHNNNTNPTNPRCQ